MSEVLGKKLFIALKVLGEPSGDRLHSLISGNNLQEHITKENICWFKKLRAALCRLNRLRTSSSRRACPATWPSPVHKGDSGTKRDAICMRMESQPIKR